MCIYVDGFSGILDIKGENVTYLADRAFFIEYRADNDDADAFTTWAYTAP